MSVLDSDLQAAPEEEAPRSGRRRRRGRLVVAVIALAVLGGGGAVAISVRNGSGGRHPAGPSLATADVVRTDLVDRTQVDGTLGYAGSSTVAANGSGHFTWLPAVGAVIHRGERAYGVDGHDVPLFYGSTPFWRTLVKGMSDGLDVRELKRNLVALGYGTDMTIDDQFTADTTAAVKAWQHDLGVTETGKVNLGDVVIRPGTLRVTSVAGTLGAPAQGQVFAATSATRQVMVNLSVSQQEIAAQGAAVQIQLPGGKSTTGHISSIGTVASSGSTGQTGQGTQTATIPVRIGLDRPSAAGRLDSAPVTVGFTGAVHKDVLAVPVTALLASANGTYSVQVVDTAGRSRYVPVQLGIFADGQVEISGSGLDAGMKVEVPKS